MSDIVIERQGEWPDSLRLARARATPALGPRLLVFSGGSALNDTSRRLKAYTHNSAHLITPFDSGGSSQILRTAFAMPAVGDLRSRLMALAEESDLGQPDTYRLFSHRLPREGAPADLAAEVVALLAGRHPLLLALNAPMRPLIASYLDRFAAEVPADFDYRGASLGNLILAGGYLDNNRALDPVLFLMSKMAEVRGTVRPIADVNLEIGAELADGRRVIGQRQVTGKEVAPLDSPISRLFLADGGRELPATAVPLPEQNRRLIARSDLILYPPGSLFSSVIANLLPAGVGRAVAARQVPKIYVPSLGQDPECLGMDLCDQIAALLAPLNRDLDQTEPPRRLISHVICDRQVPARVAEAVEARHGIPCHRLDLCAEGRADRYDPTALSELLISLC